MSHYHLEIVMPPTPPEEVEAAVTEILAKFDEGAEPDEDGYRSPHAFWDWWVIGGRWSGAKKESNLSPEDIAAFSEWCKAEKLTVSGLQFGKQELSPASQIEKVDAKWRELTGDTGPCTWFAHSGQRGALPGDICPLSEAMKVTAERVIFAVERKAVEMFETETWNDVSWLKTEFDGSMESALRMLREKRPEIEPSEDWTTVTVDYHS